MRNNEIDEESQQIGFKLSFFHILLPYCKQYYKHGLGEMNLWNSGFKGVCQENDVISQFIDSTFIKTNNNTDKIGKNQFFEIYKNVTGNRHTLWNNLLNDIKRLGIKYDGKMKTNGLAGCIIGLKIKEEDSINDEEEVVSPKKKIESVAPKKKIEESEDDIIDEESDTESEIYIPAMPNKKTKGKGLLKSDNVYLL